MKQIIRPFAALVSLFVCASGCVPSGGESKGSTPEVSAPPAKAVTFPLAIREFSDAEYPDNPDIGYRAAGYRNDFFTGGRVTGNEKEGYNLEFYGRAEVSDTVRFKNVDLSEFIPTIPAHVREDDYLTRIALLNQEFNRNQVRFGPDKFTSTNSQIVRTDVARNCLNAYLWEVILFRDSAGRPQPAYHGWFDFPHDLYAQLFAEKNGVPFADYRNVLEDWQDLESAPINLDRLRKVLRPVAAEVSDESDAMYPVAGARKKKFKEIIYPENFRTMRELQTDSARFATFTPPGFYDRSNPKTTELGRFFRLEDAAVREVSSPVSLDTLLEIELTFRHRRRDEVTRLLLGGLDPDQFPTLPVSEANAGWKSSMGISNHPFYETAVAHNATKTAKNPYYALLLDEAGQFLDSHTIGIDGPIFHLGAETESILHLWLLSFERHALVGHYRFNLK
ncbi:MAG: hypothetical protein AAGN35_14615 [Bacteroidota bacterium]